MPRSPPCDAQVGKRLRVAATFTDGAGHPEQVNSAPTTAVLNVNDVPVGVPTTNRALPQEGELITASSALVSDEDGMAGVTLRYRWQSRLNAGAFANIVGATSTTFRPTQSEVGRSLRVVVTFTDNHGTVETGVLGSDRRGRRRLRRHCRQQTSSPAPPAGTTSPVSVATTP